jgi:hypothetical protein
MVSDIFFAFFLIGHITMFQEAEDIPIIQEAKDPSYWSHYDYSGGGGSFLLVTL